MRQSLTRDGLLVTGDGITIDWSVPADGEGKGKAGAQVEGVLVAAVERINDLQAGDPCDEYAQAAFFIHAALGELDVREVNIARRAEAQAENPEPEAETDAADYPRDKPDVSLDGG